jgi:hypothetical protein
VSRHTAELIGRIVAIAALLLILANATLVDRVPPAVQSISLGRTNGDPHTGLTHTTVDVEFTKAVDPASAQLHFGIVPAVQGSFTWDGGRTMIFTPAQKLPVATRFTVTVSPGFRDVHGNVADQGVVAFAFQTVTLPALASSDPAAGASGVPVTAAISLTFDRLMDVGSTQAAIGIAPSVPFRMTWSGPTVTLTPLLPLAFGTNYVVTVTGGATDTDGNSLPVPASVQFTTVAAGLGLSQVVPADGSAGAPVNGPIAMQFDGPIDPSSVSGKLTITPPAPGDLRVEAPPDDVLGETPAPSVLVYQPASPLAPHTTYTVQLQPGVALAGSPQEVAGGRTWSFTTGAPTDSLQNQILFLSSRTGVPNLWAMNPDGSNPRQLTDELVPVTAYDATADGKRVVYAAGGLVKTFRLGDSNPTVLTPNDAFDYAPRLLPDGSAVIVGRRARLDGADQGIWLLPIDSGQSPRQLLPGGAPPTGSVRIGTGGVDGLDPGPWTTVAAVSSDGSVALLRGSGGEIARVVLASGSVTATGLRNPAGPIRWSDRDRAFLVEAAADSGGGAGPWIVPLVGRIAPLAHGGPWLDASARGDLVWLGGAAGQHATLETAAGRAPVALTVAADLADRQPSFSPAGDLVVLVRIPVSGGPSAGIWLVGTDGLALRQLSADGFDPCWLP